MCGWLYQRASAAQGGSGACRGPACFRTTFLVLAGLAAAALVAAVVLWQRTRPLYAKVIAWTKTERSKRGLRARTCWPTDRVWVTLRCARGFIFTEPCSISVPSDGQLALRLGALQ